jgi:hypothetical protein
MTEIDMTHENRSERDQHLSMARNLAQEMGVPEATVIEVYERELAQLSASAQITQFLDVITAKRVKDAFRSRRRK